MTRYDDSLLSQSSVDAATMAVRTATAATSSSGARSIVRKAGGADCTEDLGFHSAKAQKLWMQHKIGRLEPLQILPQLAQGISQLVSQASGQTNPIPLQSAATATHHKHLRHRRLLLLLQQQGHQRQGKLMFPRRTTPLTGQNRLISEVSPAARSSHPQQQRGVRLQSLSSRTLPFQSQPHNTIRSVCTCRFSARGFPGQQRHEAALLVIQQQIPVCRPLPLERIPVTVQPGLATATQPTAQQPVSENVVGKRGGTHGPTLRLPAAKS